MKEPKISGLELLRTINEIGDGHVDVVNNKAVSKENGYFYVEGYRCKPFGLYEAARKLGYK